MPDVFISYSRRNLDYVQQLVAALQKRGKDPWFDQLKQPLSGIAAGAPWWEQIKNGIEDAENFIFIVSPGSIDSPYCHAEISYAREHGKRLVPVLYCAGMSEAETRKAIDAAIEAIPDDELMPDSVTSGILNLKKLVRQNWLAISEIQYVTFSSAAFDQSLEQLVQALDLDLAWVRLQSQLTQAAKLWEASDYDNDYLWGRNRLKPVVEMIERRAPQLDPLVLRFIEPEESRLLRELTSLPPTASHERRRDIGDRLSLIGDPRPGVGVRNGIPDILWLPVTPGGQIQIQDETHRVTPFYIAQYAVTYLQYQAFVDAEDGFRNPGWWEKMPDSMQQQPLEQQKTKSLNNPRDSVSWYQSVAFARWLDTKLRQAGLLPDDQLMVRLPTEWEWQWAAQGGAAPREYPWGEWAEGYANTQEAGLSRAIAVGMYPHGAAPCGALDMSGNVAEWCVNDWSFRNKKLRDYKATTLGVHILGNGARKGTRGGSFEQAQSPARNTLSARSHPGERLPGYGLRVVLGSPIKGL